MRLFMCLFMRKSTDVLRGRRRAKGCRNSAHWLPLGFTLLAWGFLWAVAAPLWAQSGATQGASASSPAAVSSSSTESRVAKLEQDIAEARSSGDNGWMLVSSALVLMMTGPGLALFYGGLVRKKNVLATMMQSFALMALITVLWAVVGYSLRSEERRVGKGGRSVAVTDE